MCVETYARILEGCWCHQHVWAQKTSCKRKKSALVAETGHRLCVWKNRMGPWWVACGIRQMLAELSRCSSERLDAWIASLPDVAKVGMLRRLQLMRSRLIETLLFKLEFFFHIPFRALGIFWAECGGVLSVCQQICRECIAEYEQATQLGRRVHRVAHRLFRIGTVCRAELDLWVLSSLPLRCFREAWRLLLEYARCPLTERCIEAVHALIQRVGRVATNSNPPYVVAKVRETQISRPASGRYFVLQLCRRAVAIHSFAFDRALFADT